MEEAIAAPESEAITPPASFEAFFEEHRQEVFGAVWMIVRDRQETEDLVQEAFVKVLERWDRFGQIDDPTAYIDPHGAECVDQPPPSHHGSL